jgi:hypothetical protein
MVLFPKLFTSAALLISVLGLTGTVVQAANPVVCTAYAQGAIFQQNRNLAMGCGYSGLRWMNNFGAHYAWCLGAPYGAVQAEGNIRKSMLQQCAGGGNKTKTFVNPKYKGLRLDWCYSWTANCGAYAAKAYCVSRGYPLLKAWGFAENIGTYTNTRVFSTSQVCHGPDCDGFSYITCKK